MTWRVKLPEERYDARVHAAVSVKQRRRLEQVARRREVSVSHLVREGLDLLLAENGGKPRDQDEREG